MECLQTTFLVDLLKGKDSVAHLKEELTECTTFSIDAPSLMELWSGVLLATNSEKEKKKVNELLESLQILPLDANSAREAAEIEADLLRRGISVETEDIMIAAIAKVNAETLVSRDRHYASIPGLKLLKY
jgi:predicted nucleic acid-binding protein